MNGEEDILDGKTFFGHIFDKPPPRRMTLSTFLTLAEGHPEYAKKVYHNIPTSAPVQEYENALKRIAIDSSNYQTLHKRWHDGTWKVPGVVALPGLGSEELERSPTNPFTPLKVVNADGSTAHVHKTNADVMIKSDTEWDGQELVFFVHSSSVAFVKSCAANTQLAPSQPILLFQPL